MTNLPQTVGQTPQHLCVKRTADRQVMTRFFAPSSHILQDSLGSRSSIICRVVTKGSSPQAIIALRRASRRLPVESTRCLHDQGRRRSVCKPISRRSNVSDLDEGSLLVYAHRWAITSGYSIDTLLHRLQSNATKASIKSDSFGAIPSGVPMRAASRLSMSVRQVSLARVIRDRISGDDGVFKRTESGLSSRSRSDLNGSMYAKSTVVGRKAGLSCWQARTQRKVCTVTLKFLMRSCISLRLCSIICSALYRSRTSVRIGTRVFQANEYVL